MSTQSSIMNTRSMVAILLAAAFMAILNQTLLTTALPHIMRDYGITADMGQMGKLGLHVSQRCNDPDHRLSHREIYNKKVVFCRDGVVRSRNTRLCNCTYV